MRGRVAGVHRRLPRRAVRPADRGRRPPYLDPAGATAWPAEYPEEFRDSDAGSRRLRPPQRWRGPRLAGRLLHRRRAAPLRRSRSRPCAARSAARLARPVRRREPRSPTTSTTCCRRSATDPVGLAIVADHDLRVLQPRQVTDANGNSTSATFSPAGFVTASFVRGKNGEGDADGPQRADGVRPAGVRRARPAGVGAHDRAGSTTTPTPTSPPTGATTRSSRSSTPTGSGALLQTRAQAEDVLFGDAVFGGGVLSADQTEPVTATVGRARQPGAPDNVVVSGWQVYDNKGRVVEKYEPFFATGFDFAAPVDAELGQKATIVLRPARPGRSAPSTPTAASSSPCSACRSTSPTPTCSRRPRGSRSPTTPTTTPAAPTAPAAEGYRSHWNTPASIEVDALGRTVVVVARNGPDPDTDWFVTRSTYDIQGNLLALTDALGRVAFRYRYDLAGRRWRMDSIDAGRRDTVLDAARRRRREPRRQGRAHARRLRRAAPADPGVGPRRRRRAGHAAAARRVRRRRRPRPTRRRPRRRHAPTTCSAAAVAHYDEAGLVTVADVDFKGNVLEASRRVIADAPILAVYERAAADGWQVDTVPRRLATRSRPDPGRARRRAARRRRLPDDDQLRRPQPGHPCRPCRPTSRAAAASCAPSTTAPAGWSRCALDDTAVRRAHRLRRQGPAHARRLRQRRDDPLRLRPATRSGWPGCAASATRADGLTYRPTGQPTPGLRLRLRPGRQHPRRSATGRPGAASPTTPSPRRR